MKLALYKGPPQNNWFHTITHYATRLWTWSKYSHAELVIDGICYTSSARDGGVRAKAIDLSSGRWDVFDITSSETLKTQALAWFAEHEYDEYDYRNLVRFVLPFVKHSENKWVCYEAVGAALGLKNPHKLDAEALLHAARNLK